MKRKESNIKTYTGDELAAMRARGESQSDWAAFDAMTDAELERLIAEDPDERDMVVDWSKAVLVMPEAKAHINLRVDQDVLQFFKRGGRGYQTRMNAVLRSYMEAHRERRPGS